MTLFELFLAAMYIAALVLAIRAWIITENRTGKWDLFEMDNMFYTLFLMLNLCALALGLIAFFIWIISMVIEKADISFVFTKRLW